MAIDITHFILIGGKLTPQYRRAIYTATHVQGTKVWLWLAGKTKVILRDLKGLGNVRVGAIEIPKWLENEATAHIWDVLAYRIGFEWGGLVLGLDTISLLRADNLITTEDVVLSTDWPAEDHGRFPDCYNNNFLAKKGSPGAHLLYETAMNLVLDAVQKPWGYTGPVMLTKLVKDNPGVIGAAPYPALCGWSPGYIWRFYLGHERPDPNTRVIHLCAQAYRHLYEGNYDAWANQYPDYAGPVERRTSLNADLLECPAK